jgi:hypothetical protein
MHPLYIPNISLITYTQNSVPLDRPTPPLSLYKISHLTSNLLSETTLHTTAVVYAATFSFTVGDRPLNPHTAQVQENRLASMVGEDKSGTPNLRDVTALRTALALRGKDDVDGEGEAHDEDDEEIEKEVNLSGTWVVENRADGTIRLLSTAGVHNNHDIIVFMKTAAAFALRG